MNNEILAAIATLGVTRLCHFTPSRNLPHIIADQAGVLCTRALKDDEKAVFTATDNERIDGYDAHVCCSIEYPNAWYLSKARKNEAIFKDWVILFIRPEYLALTQTGLCARNAAAGWGRYVGFGFEAFQQLYAPSVVGSGGRTYTRSPHQLSCSPTDEQAEVLVPDSIRFADILGFAVRDEVQAKNEHIRLSLAGLPTAAFKVVIAPTLFEPNSLSAAIHQGRRAPEIEWIPT